MASNNPSVTASDLILDVENRLGNPSISTSIYLPWVSYSYQKVYQALSGVSQEVKERLFGAFVQYTLTNGTAEYSLNTIMPRFGGVIKFEILFGGTGDQRVRLQNLPTLSAWDNQANISTSYRTKTNPVYYNISDILGIIPTPPADDPANAILYAWYIKRPYQITDGADVIDIPYRFQYPIINYIQAKAIQKAHEDYGESRLLEARFEEELQQIAEAADSEHNENDGTSSIAYSSSDALGQDPFNRN